MVLPELNQRVHLVYLNVIISFGSVDVIATHTAKSLQKEIIGISRKGDLTTEARRLRKTSGLGH